MRRLRYSRKFASEPRSSVWTSSWSTCGSTWTPRKEALHFCKIHNIQGTVLLDATGEYIDRLGIRGRAPQRRGRQEGHRPGGRHDHARRGPGHPDEAAPPLRLGAPGRRAGPFAPCRRPSGRVAAAVASTMMSAASADSATRGRSPSRSGRRGAARADGEPRAGASSPCAGPARRATSGRSSGSLPHDRQPPRPRLCPAGGGDSDCGRPHRLDRPVRGTKGPFGRIRPGRPGGLDRPPVSAIGGPAGGSRPRTGGPGDHAMLRG